MADERDVFFMRRALALAERGWGQTAPNPMVGAVVVQHGDVVGEGHHGRFGEPHAEVHALRAAGELARGATLYVTLEPCNHHGKTPPCTDAVLAAGIRRVVVAMRDPNPQAAGGLERLRAAGIDIGVGVCEAEARELNAAFIFAFTSSRPWVTLKLALSIDGAIADAHHTARGWISNELSRAEVQRLRANVDAIAVGVGTAIADDPSLTARGAPPPRVPPLRVVFDRSHRLPMDRTVVRTADAIPTAIMHEPNLHLALTELKDRGVRSLMVEGGAGMASEFLRNDLVDRLVIFQAPVILGRGALNGFGGVPPVEVRDAVRFRVLRRQVFGDDIMTIYALHAV